MGYIDRTKKENIFRYEIEKEVGKKEYGKLIDLAYRKHGTNVTVSMIDDIKNLGFKFSTLASISLSLFDMTESNQKEAILKEADEKVAQNNDLYLQGFMSEADKRERNIKIWNDATAKVMEAVVGGLDKFNPLKMMADSKARGNNDQIKQLSGMQGITAVASGVRSDIPVKSSFRRGLTPIEYFSAARGSRKQLMDTAMKTADSGYLTRRLVDVAQDTVVTEVDCFEALGESVKGMEVTEIVKDGTLVESLENRIIGRYSVNAIINPKTKQEICPANEYITADMASEIVNAGITKVNIRTLLTCKARRGVCAKCYGRNMSKNSLVDVGEAVGVIAAQSIGEPGTQLTMRTFHTGGAATADITQGLPRVEEIFEARNPKGAAFVSEIAGKVTINNVDKRYEVVVKGETEQSYILPYGSVLKVQTGDTVQPGTALTEGPINPRDILHTRGVKAVQEYLLNEVLSVYKSQSVDINAKHLEIIIRQMLRKVRIENSGDTNLLPGDSVDISVYEDENNRVLAEGGVPATAKRELQGITKASLTTESFLSASSFQETSSVLTEAALKGKVDHLLGLKENVIIGKLIPAGTGCTEYRSMMPKEVESDKMFGFGMDADIKFADIDLE